MTTVSDAITVFERLWPSSDAEEWDRPGLVVGDASQELRAILLAVDLTAEVAAEAKQSGANLILTHHPYLLRGVHSIAEGTLKGGLLSELVRSSIASFAAHTNADIAEHGVSQVFAQALDLQDISALTVDGHGRVGHLPREMTLGEFAKAIHTALPSTTRGVSSSGDLHAVIRKVALCGGAGDSFIAEAVASGADVYVTSDLRHHVTQDAGIPLVDVSHWAGESLWLEVAKSELSKHLDVPIQISAINTDPWKFRI